MKTSLNEVWANIPDYNDYQISNYGRVRSYKQGKIKIIKSWVQNTGYLTVSLNNKKYSVHRLVAEVFIHKIEGKNVVNHIDGNKLNNKVDNLEWCTAKENIQHAFRTGLMDKVIKQMKQKKIRAKNIGQFDLDGKLLAVYHGSVEAQNHLRNQGISINARNIRNVCQGNRKSAGGFLWKYLEG